MDEELLEAFLPEWQANCDRLAAAPDDARALAALRGLAEAPGAEALMPHVGVMAPRALAALAETLLRGQPRVSGAALGFSAGASFVASPGNAIGAPTGAPPGTPPASPPASSPGTPPPARVLVVDDSPTMRRILRDILAQDPAFTLAGEAADGEEGLAAMARLQPALTLLDIEMPVLDGLGLLRRWALRGPGEILVVSSAAQAGSDVALEARRLGACGVVAKPSGAISLDMEQRRGDVLLAAARAALGLPGRHHAA